MKKLIAACAALIVAAGIMAQTPRAEFKLWDAAPPTDNGVTGPEVNKDGVSTYVTEPRLTVFVPEHPNGQCVLACPGGAYFAVCHGTEGFPMAQWYLNQGISYAVLIYRLPNGHHEVPLQDVHRAMDILNEHRTEWGITSIGIQGASAGGHLAATAAIHYDKPEHRPDFQILFYPVITLEVAHTHRGSLTQLLGPDPSPQLVDHYCLEKHVTADTPPAFVMHSSNDDVVPLRNSLQYCQALSDKGVYQSLHVYPVGGHGWAFHEWFPFKYQWTAELAQWLAQLRMTQGK